MTTVISVRFRGGCKEYYFDPHGIEVEAGQFVIVETSQGTEYAQCLIGNHEVEDESIVSPLRPLVRIATENDTRTMEYNRSREKEAFALCQKKIAERGLEMKLIRVESNFDGSKIVFFFTSENRVDFRELVRDLAGVFRARIELRQIGVRDEAKMLGGLGICGRPFCCSQFLDDFMPVSIKMAKTQNLSLNPTKISGTCGRLMCCLKYEQEAYEDAVKRMPKQESFVLTPDGPGNVSTVNLVRETVNVRLDTAPESQKCYHNCEICILRNGKGSREGIDIPTELPKRREKPLTAAEEPFAPFAFETAAAEDFPAAKPEERVQEKRSSRSRHSSRRRRTEKSVTSEKVGEKQSASEKKVSRPTTASKAQQPRQTAAKTASRSEVANKADASDATPSAPKPHRSRSRRGHGRRSAGPAAPKAD